MCNAGRYSIGIVDPELVHFEISQYWLYLPIQYQYIKKGGGGGGGGGGRGRKARRCFPKDREKERERERIKSNQIKFICLKKNTRFHEKRQS